VFHKEAEFQDSKVGQIPRGWRAVRIGEITLEHKQGFYTNKAYSEKGIKLVRITDLLNPELSYVTMPNLFLDPKTIEQFKVSVGDFLVARSGAIGRYGIVKQDIPCVFGSYIIRFRFDSGAVENRFFGYVWESKHILSQLLRLKHGATNININANNIKSIVIPLPSVSEQQRIVEVLSCVDLAIQKTDDVIVKTEHLKKGLMQKLLTEGIGHKEFKDTEIGKIPKEWEVTTIDYECILGTGGTPSRTNPQYYGGKIPWVKSTEVDYCIIRETEETLTEYGLQNSNAKIYPTGSLVIALYGQGITRGKCAIFGIDAAVNQACAVVQSKGWIYIPFLFYWFQKSYSWIRSLSQGANQSNLNMTIIRSLKFPLPPRLEQEKIAEILTNLDKKLGLERDQRTRIGRIKLGLMDLLLTGKVRVKVD
jgi:type I restriction enzyme S subunit